MTDNTDLPKIILSDEELTKLNNLTLTRKLVDTEQQLIFERIKIKQQELRILELQSEIYKRDIGDLRNIADNNGSKILNLKQQYSDYIKQLNDIYDLPESWGVNPETGEIIIN